MKTLLQIFVVSIVISVGTSSCNKDILNTIPDDRLSTDIFWKTEADARLAVNALYTHLDGTNILSWDALTDIAHTNQLANSQTFIELGTYDISNSKVLDEWSAAYRGIQATNYFLENVDKVVASNATLIDQFKGEARFLRAYQYLKLAGFFGDVPLVTQTITIEQGRALQRTPVNEIWKFIDAELEAAAGLLPATYGAAEKGRITSGAAWALKSRADLFAGRYQDAIDAARKVTGYALYSSYEKLFSYAAENNAEVILDKQFIKDNYPNNVFNLLTPYSQKNGSSLFVPTRALVDLYETSDGLSIEDPGSGYDPYHPYDNRDPRLKFSVYLEGDVLPAGNIFQPAPNSGTTDAVGATFVSSTTGFNIKKYINTEDYANPANGGINMILIRYAEVLLTLAEAKIELNQVDQEVYDAINAVRNQRTDVKQPALSTGQDQTALRSIVRRERTIEFAFEGLHFFDIRRWKTAETVLTGPVKGISYIDNGELLTVTVAGVNKVFEPSRHYLWPIPLNERNLNPNLSQNPNW